jgi:hypothetical protein
MMGASGVPSSDPRLFGMCHVFVNKRSLSSLFVVAGRGTVYKLDSTPVLRSATHCGGAAAEDLGGLGGILRCSYELQRGSWRRLRRRCSSKRPPRPRRAGPSTFEEPARLPLAPLTFRRARPSPARCACQGWTTRRSCAQAAHRLIAAEPPEGGALACGVSLV